jgi:hypothetical protein
MRIDHRYLGQWVSAGRLGELGDGNLEGLAVIQLVPFRGLVVATFPAVDVVVHAVNAGHGGVAGIPAGLDQPAGLLPPGP